MTTANDTIETLPALRFNHPTHPVLTSIDFIKSIYLNLLEAFPDEVVIAFWDAHPLHINGRQLSTHELLAHLWQEKAMVSLVWSNSAYQDLEPLLVTHNITFLEFFRKLLYRNNNSTFIPGRFLLKWFYPVMKRIFHAGPRDMMIQLIPFFSANAFPHSIARRVKKWVDAEWTNSVMIYISDDTFLETIHFDAEIAYGEQIRACPGVMGLPPFEEIGIIAETRPLEMVLWKGQVIESEGIATLDGQIIGHRLDFESFCREKEIDLSAFNVPATSGILIEKDYSCPIRKRIVLHAGCIYGVPVHLLTIRHKRLKDFSRDVLTTMVFDLEEDQPPLAKRLQARHEALLTKLQKKVLFKYFPDDESITLNGEHFMKGISAKILKSLITAYIKDGRCEFEYREFKRDFEISLGQKNANFEVRFYRLVEKLKEECPSIAIKKIGRGRFTLKVSSKVSYEEGG
jgi:hypothetical protein